MQGTWVRSTCHTLWITQTNKKIDAPRNKNKEQMPLFPAVISLRLRWNALKALVLSEFPGLLDLVKSWNSSTLATSCEELTHWKRLWCWEGLGAGGEGDDRGWDGWMASLTWWMWVWVNSPSWWWTGRPGVLGFIGSQRVGHDWATELNWTEAS